MRTCAAIDLPAQWYGIVAFLRHKSDVTRHETRIEAMMNNAYTVIVTREETVLRAIHNVLKMLTIRAVANVIGRNVTVGRVCPEIKSAFGCYFSQIFDASKVDLESAFHNFENMN